MALTRKGAKALDMTKGSALRLLVSFTIPTLLGNLLNQVYSITDSIIVGRVLGQTALAAVGVCMPIIFLTASLVFGLNLGIGIIFSQCVGKKDLVQMRSVFANGIYMGLILGVAMIVVGLPIAAPVLRLMGTPEGPMQEAASYMRVNFATSLFPVFYFLFSNVARGMGDSYTSLYCLILSVVSNIALDFLFVAGLGLGVAGSAWATALAQLLSAVFALIMLYVKYPEIRLKRVDLRPDGSMFKRIFSLAFPISLQSAFNNFGNVVVQSAINGFGEAVMAAYTAAGRLGTLALMPVETVGSSLSFYAGQNYGAKKYRRVSEGVRAALVIDLVVSVVLGGLLLAFGRSMTLLFLEDAGEEILRTASSYLLYAAVPGILYGVMQVYQQVLRGVNHVRPSVIGGFMQLGTKVLVAAIGAWVLKDLTVVWIAWPVSYVMGTLLPYAAYRIRIRKLVQEEDEQPTEAAAV